MFSTIIKQPLVYDGTGSKPVLADVALEGDKIVSIKPHIEVAAKQTIPANGLVLTPGFIDVQNHSDTYWQIFENPGLDNMIAQGYTTIIVGATGSSLAPILSAESLKAAQKWQSIAGVNVNWRTFKEYIETLKHQTYGTNILSMTGYSTVRRGVMGDSLELASLSDLEMIKKVIIESFDAGSCGLSVGLQYSHELNITIAELMTLALLCAQYNKVLSVSVRDDLNNFHEQIEELVGVAEETKVNLKISHLKFRKELDKEALNQVLNTIEHAWQRGVQIHFDSYPYSSTWQPLYSYLPNWAIYGGRLKMLERLQDSLQRKRVVEHLSSKHGLSELLITSSEKQLWSYGKTIKQLSESFGLGTAETILKIIEHGGYGTMVIDNGLDWHSTEIVNSHPLGFMSTNGAGFNINHKGSLLHPRCFGSAPKFLNNIIKNKNISLQEGVRKLTSMPAKIYGLQNRGEIKVDNIADLVLFDPNKINSLATENNAQVYPNGINSVFVAGNLTWHNNAMVTEKYFGTCLN